MWIFAYTINHGDNDLRDCFDICDDEQTARKCLADKIEQEPNLHCACIGPIIAATEPHWVTP